jgi:hypothetical protein
MGVVEERGPLGVGEEIPQGNLFKKRKGFVTQNPTMPRVMAMEEAAARKRPD